MTTFTLKLIAVITMLIDHTGVLLVKYYGNGFFFMRVIGRIAFPIYAFLIAEGCRRTSNIKRYLGRLLAFALVSEIAYNIFKNASDSRLLPIRLESFLSPNNQNVFFTLFLGALVIYCLQLINDVEFNQRKWKSSLPAFGLGAALLADYFNTDYGLLGVVLIVGCYLCGENRRRVVLYMTLWLFVQYFLENISWLDMAVTIFGGSFVSVLCVYLYNGHRGPRLKWFFYAFYPLHLITLSLIFSYFIFI